MDQAVARHPGVQRRLPAHQRVRLHRLRSGGVWVRDELNKLCSQSRLREMYEFFLRAFACVWQKHVMYIYCSCW
uniref:Uncharacterized protein n=1 Tax=Arundo donax TaxID=35708 RepID=A0A0A8ZVD5_ARUDO